MRDKLKQTIRTIAAHRGDESGVAVVMVLLVTALLLGLGIALSTNAMTELDIATNHQRQEVAWYAAEMGLEQGIDAFRNNYSPTSMPEDGTALFDKKAIEFQGTGQNGDYTVTLARRDSTGTSPIAPFPIFYTVTSVGRYIPSNARVQPASVTLTQTVAVTPQTLANWTLFYNQFAFNVEFQSTFRLTGRLAVNDLNGVHVVDGTTVNGDFYAAGEIYGHPIVSGNVTAKGGTMSFPNTIDPFSAGAQNDYKFSGTTRLIFQSDGTVVVHNNGRSGSPLTMPIPSNGIIAVDGDAIVEGTVHGRCTVTSTGSALINGDVRYSDHSPNSTDTLAVVAQNDVIEPQFYYTGVTGSSLQGFSTVWNGGHWQADGINGGTWGNEIRIANPKSGELPGDFHIDATLISLTGSSPTVINPGGRPAGNLYIYGNSIANIASVTVYMNGNSISAGLNEIYTQNSKLDMLPPPGFPFFSKLIPSFLAFREVRAAMH